jgi:cytochrome oxidase Cu insertion factor (SCO1/SenC/PrrC family)
MKSILVICGLMFSFLVPPVITDGPTLAAAREQKSSDVYTCPMDPEVKSAKPGKCPKCGMDLRSAAEAAAQATSPGEGRFNMAQIPDTIVYDQDGRQLRFYSDLVKGKTVAINFIFTTCTTICPPLTATFRKLQQELGKRAGSDVQLISISVDPTTDVPERLKGFAAKFNAGPGWSFITGGKPEIDQLLGTLGAGVVDKVDHTPMVLIGNDETGYWTRAYGLASAGTLIKVVAEAASAEAATHADANVPMPEAGGASAGERRVERRLGDKSANALVNNVKSRDQAAAAYFTNLVLLTQENKPVHFYDDLLKDKIVLINFIFTSCKGVCSPMTANLRKVQEYLGDRVGKEINMITISVDPLVDTPEVLANYTAGFKINPGWYFLTGKKENIDQVLRKLGGFVEKRDEHSTVLLIGNLRSGEWTKAHAMLSPAQIADAVTALAASEGER